MQYLNNESILSSSCFSSCPVVLVVMHALILLPRIIHILMSILLLHLLRHLIILILQSHVLFQVKVIFVQLLLAFSLILNVSLVQRHLFFLIFKRDGVSHACNYDIEDANKSETYAHYHVKFSILVKCKQAHQDHEQPFADSTLQKLTINQQLFISDFSKYEKSCKPTQVKCQKIEEGISLGLKCKQS